MADIDQASDGPPVIPACKEAPADERASVAVNGREMSRFQKRLNLWAASFIIVVALVFLLQTFATVLQHLLVAIFLVYLLMPPYRWLIQRGFSPVLAGILMVAGILIAFTGVGLVIGNSISDLQAKLPSYRAGLTRLIESNSARIPGLGPQVMDWWNHNAPDEISDVMQMVQSALQAVSGFLSQSFVVLVYLLFILAERTSLRQRMEKAFRPERGRHIHAVVVRINAAITEYIVVKTLMSVLGGVLTWAVLFAFGVDYAPVWGMMAFLFNYIPYLGSIVATVLPVLLSLVQFENPILTLVILALLLIMQNSIGYLIEPRLAGRRLDLSPLVIILSLAFWGSLWGIVGMILAVPLLVTIKTILEEMPVTRPLARMLSNT
jgi:predicted PurR-regulated permease PerM